MLKTAAQEIRDEVLAELDADPRVDSSRIGVSIQDGAVTLSGTVPTLAQKWAAEEAAKRIKGVVSVAQEIEVDLPALHQRTDSDIARAVADALYWDTSVPSTVQATVQNGFATLTGEVEWHYQRDDAESVVRRISGVRGVSDRITLRKSVAPGDIKAQVQRLFQRDAQLDANKVHVTTELGKVTLTGTVHSWYERNEASRAAWAVKGVTSVENRLTVV